jgi:multiple sugar transport system substrate-binding protein
MSKRRRFSRGAVLASVSLMLASLGVTSLVGSAEASTAPGTTYPTVPAHTQVSIKLASYLPVIGTQATNTLNSFIQGFEAIHPNIHVTVEPETSTTQGAISAQVQQDAVVGQTPDIVQVGFGEMRNVVKNFGGADLTKVVGKGALGTEFGGTNPYAPAVTKLGVINGDVYGVPWTLSTPMLFYNADLFTKAGLNPQNPPTTWTQLNTDAQVIKASTGASGLANGCIGAAAGGADWCLQSIILSAGGTVMNANQSKTTFSNSKLISAMKTMQALGSSGSMVNLTSAQATAAWGAGQLAMVVNSSAIQATLVKADGGHFNMMAARLPGFGSSPSVPTNSGSALVMLSSKKTQREADWELIQYLTTASSMTSITENIGYVPLRPSITTDAQYLASWASANQFLPPNIYQLEHIKPWLAYPGSNYVTLQSDLVDAATSIAFQNANPKTTMATAQTQASALLP